MLRKNRAFTLVTLSLAAVLLFAASTPLEAFNFKRLFRRTAKVLGVAALVRVFARPLNDFVNRLLLNNQVENRQSTKVVPIVSFGERKAIGAAQVSGTDEALSRVRAVILFEDVYSDKRFRIKAMVPGSSSNPEHFERVYGIGITAVIDVKL